MGLRPLIAGMSFDGGAALPTPPSDGHPYGFKDGAVVRLKDSSISPFATNVSSVAGWTVTGDTPLLVGTDVRFANPGSVTDISLADSFDAGATLDFSELTGLLTIGSSAFINQTNLIGALEFPESLTSIGDYAFNGCTGFTGILTIPSSVTALGAGAFQNCSGLTGDLTIPNSVTSIGTYAFYACSGFTGTLTIPSSVTAIGSRAFYICTGFTALTLPSSVTSIGSYAFRNCTGFTGTLTIPSSVTSIGGYAFRSCSGLTRVDAYVALSVIDVTSSLLGTSVTSIHARSSDGTWTAGAGQTVGGKTGITVTKDL